MNLNSDSVVMILAVVAGFNIVLTGAKSILDAIKDKTESTADNKAAEILGKVIGYISGALGFLSANK